MIFITTWKDERTYGAPVAYRLSVSKDSYALERASKDRLGGDRWDLVSEIPAQGRESATDSRALLAIAVDILAAKVTNLETEVARLKLTVACTGVGGTTLSGSAPDVSWTTATSPLGDVTRCRSGMPLGGGSTAMPTPGPGCRNDD